MLNLHVETKNTAWIDHLVLSGCTFTSLAALLRRRIQPKLVAWSFQAVHSLAYPPCWDEEYSLNMLFGSFRLFSLGSCRSNRNSSQEGGGTGVMNRIENQEIHLLQSTRRSYRDNNLIGQCICINRHILCTHKSSITCIGLETRAM